ncbi:MAG: DUF805 domain-containing protein [Woeseiaceae bacterium]|nr:DUF805 domain-containing protein [Woeseiaceae bacterium]
MIRQKRFQSFTLRRLPFWVFLAAGVSGLTLSPLFQNWMATGIVVAMSSAVILTSLAARFRDVGLSAWLAPLAVIPAVALIVGFTRGDGVEGPKASDGHQFVHTVMFTLMSSGTWIALLVN